MSRKKSVTSVNINPSIMQAGRDAKLNFSQILEEGIISALKPGKEKEYLIREVDEHHSKIDELMKRINDLDKLEESLQETVFDELESRYIEEYKLMGTLPDAVMYRYSVRLGVSQDELEERLRKAYG